MYASSPHHYNLFGMHVHLHPPTTTVLLPLPRVHHTSPSPLTRLPSPDSIPPLPPPLQWFHGGFAQVLSLTHAHTNTLPTPYYLHTLPTPYWHPLPLKEGGGGLSPACILAP